MSKNKIFKQGLWDNHPIFRQLLGMCPTLATTTNSINGLFMGASVIFVVVSSSLIVSLIRRFVPNQIRIAVYTIIIATFVTLVDIFLKAFFYDISKVLGPYVPLIIVNCIIFGRIEAFASKNPCRYSFWDSLGMGLGFLWGLFVLGSIRELLSQGSILGFVLLKETVFPRWVVMVLPAGAFLVLGLWISFMNFLELKRDR